MRPEPGQVLHFSEDPTIERFVPHVAATAREASPYVWAVDHDRAPDYWFPRECPRAMAWVRDGTSSADQERIIGAGCGVRVHAIEYAWWDANAAAGIQLRVLPDLWPFWDAVTASTAGFSAIRMRNARPRQLWSS